ncbi:hypothetical protein NX059_000253 [Plenodomus lindquistii]|nr:hypothetical protein NX059_000253 [Plenodomus lindquistii]
MAFEKLNPMFTTTILCLQGLILAICVLPFFASWRFLNLLLSCGWAPLRAAWIPNLTLHNRSHALFRKQWQAFLKLRPIIPLVKYRVRIICCTLLIFQSILAFTILTKSCILFLPWLIQGVHSNGALRVNIVFFLGTCVPISWLGGVGVAALYYARKVWKYGRFEKKMRKRPGGRGYWMDPGEVEDKRKGAEADGNACGEAAGTDCEKEGVAEGRGVRWTGSTLGDGEHSPTPESGRPSVWKESVQRPGTAARWKGNSSAPIGLSAIQHIRDNFQKGYDGREVRRAAWKIEDLEMNLMSKR